MRYSSLLHTLVSRILFPNNSLTIAILLVDWCIVKAIEEYFLSFWILFIMFSGRGATDPTSVYRLDTSNPEHWNNDVYEPACKILDALYEVTVR